MWQEAWPPLCIASFQEGFSSGRNTSPSLETCDGGILQPINHRWLLAGVSPQDVIWLRYRIKSLSPHPCEWSVAGPDGAVGLQGWFVLQLKFLGIQVAITLGAPHPWLKMYIFLKASGQDFRSISSFPFGLGNNLRESFLFLVISKKWGQRCCLKGSRRKHSDPLRSGLPCLSATAFSAQLSLPTVCSQVKVPSTYSVWILPGVHCRLLGLCFFHMISFVASKLELGFALM